jgi:hypothetical protein
MRRFPYSLQPFAGGFSIVRKTFFVPTLLATAVATFPGAAQATSTTCSTSVVCGEYVNTYSGTSGGVAIHGESNTGIGIRGTSVSNTGFYGASGSGSYLAPGVEGESTNNAGSDAGGAFGLSFLATGKAPQFGALAYGRGDGLYGESESPGTSSNYGYGVFGRETQGAAAGDYNAGVIGESTYGAGMIAETNGTPTYLPLFAAAGIPVGIYATAEAGSTGSKEGAAIFGESNSFPLEVLNTGPATEVVNLAAPGSLIMASAAQSAGGSSIIEFIVDTAGNEKINGTLTTSKGTYVRTTGGSGAARMSYGARMTAPDIEDVGEGEMVDGRAVVKIDAALADSIDMRRAYHVFITPEGDCNQLYVTQKTPSGFVVRESHAGRSTLAFDYRIVAKPLDDNGTRLAAAPPLERPTGLMNLTSHGRASAPPVSPQDALRERLGPQGYAKALADVRSRVAGR